MRPRFPGAEDFSRTSGGDGQESGTNCPANELTGV